MRKIGVVTTSRADFGIYLPILHAIDADPALELSLIVGGMHLAPEFGLTVRDIEAAGFRIDERVEMLLSSDTGLGVAKSMGLGVMSFAEAFARTRPDLLLVLGDRFEMHAASLASLPLSIPLAHVHGGEVTEGAIDDALRHGITKIAHLHFAATQQYADRIVRMGEEPWRVVVSGAPSLDNIDRVQVLDRASLSTRLGAELTSETLLVTYHPATRELGAIDAKIDAFLAALARIGRPAIVTLSNADPGGRFIAQRFREFAAEHRQVTLVDNLGTQAYFSLMKHAAAMVGNSSSGIIEAASFSLPVVNVGSRQRGRSRGANVIDVERDEDPAQISAAIERAVSPEFHASLAGMENIYGDGTAAATIVRHLRDAMIDDTLLMKRFYDG